MGVGGQRHTLAALFPGKRPAVCCTGGWGGPHGWSVRVRKNSPALGFDPQTVKPEASSYI
jgi:hypothetical protein